LIRSKFSSSLTLAALLAAGLLGASSARAAGGGVWTGAGPGSLDRPGGSTVPAQEMPGPLRQVGYDQRLGAQAPLDRPFVDEAGRAVRLGDYFPQGGRRPVLLVMAYYHCPMLCDMVLTAVAGSLKTLTFTPGQQYDVVVASIDPHETPQQAAESRHRTIRRFGRTGTEAGWHFLTGPQESISALAASVGFRYVYDAKRNEFAHAAGIVILTPEGRVSRYLYGLDYAPRDVRLALIESADHKIGSLADQALLYCFHYDPSIGRYSAMTMRLIRVGGALTLLGVILMITLLRRRVEPAEIVGAARP
jgi:protein SCO1/2